VSEHIPIDFMPLPLQFSIFPRKGCIGFSLSEAFGPLLIYYFLVQIILTYYALFFVKLLKKLLKDIFVYNSVCYINPLFC
jgi:hypothetical protein